MNRQELLKIQRFNSYPSVSILLPTFRSAPDNRQDPIRVKNLIKQTVARLSQEFSPREFQSLIGEIEKLEASIDYQHALDGLALFASKDFSGVYYLPFPVQERVVIDHTFATRDLVFALNRSTQYWVLSLSEKFTRLYSGTRDHLVELKGNSFPMVFEGPGGTEPMPGGYGVEKSSYLDERHKNFFREVAKAFGKTAGPEPAPLVLAGVDRFIAFYNEVCDHPQIIAGTLTGNHDHTPLSELSRPAWEMMEKHQTRFHTQLLEELDSMAAAKKHAGGIDDCWKAAREGRVARLLVEDDFMYPAILGQNGTLSPVADSTLPGVIDDAVDELLEAVIAKGGRIYFLKKGLLSGFGSIAAMLRY